MSSSSAAAAVTEKCCASCGVAEIDDVKLKPCPKCDLAFYCGDECRQRHREKHEAICKERAVELYDELLFKQPESNHHGDCPICFLPMSNHGGESVIIHACCGKITCGGCDHANDRRMVKEGLKEDRCPFCRHLNPRTQAEAEELCIERAKLNDPFALEKLGSENYHTGNFDEAFQNYTKAAALGNAESMFRLAGMYHDGEGVEEDSAKERVLLEKAAIAGHPAARHDLGCLEQYNGTIDRAVLHWIIASNLGDEDSIKALKECYKRGFVSKDDFAAALRANQAAVDATKSPQRAVAEAYYNV